MSAELSLFYFFAALAVGSALSMVLNLRNTVASAMSLVITMVSLAAVYVLMEAHLVAVLQIMVYGGAIVVLFVFVVMLLNLRQDDFPPGRQRGAKALGVVLVVFAVIKLLALLPAALPDTVAALPEGFGGYRDVGTALFTRFILPFEATSLLLLSALVGAVVLAKRRLD
ncbi:MAG: NADH-quinone oxidoreductase subunit J [Deltaproteobacteria bacterium]|nr:NADH-quinone oxidoreductase subunit J [Deltaproteobacteria bacterium]MBW2444564.1 NADH-quinone oxidoreductase subunit J [Deltaproteobacteria bacterium]